MKHECWGEDREDLTEKVEVAEALLPGGGDGRDCGSTVFALTGLGRRANSPTPDPRVVLVNCTKGHENIFEVGAEGADTIPGVPPKPAQKAAFAAAANLTPDKSLARTQELAKFVFSNVAVIGLLLTGLGLFTDLGDVLENSLKLPDSLGGAPVAVAALGLSLLCASFAIWPKMSAVDLANLAKVEGWYRCQIRRRGLWMIASLFFFSLAILVATFTGIGSLDDPEKPTISASWTGLEKDAKVKVAIKVEKVPDEWALVTVVRGFGPDGKPVTILRDRTRPGADGELAVAGEVGVGERFERIESTARLLSDDAPANEPEAESKLVLRRG
jgi:hypothetical protein